MPCVSTSSAHVGVSDVLVWCPCHTVYHTPTSETTSVTTRCDALASVALGA